MHHIRHLLFQAIACFPLMLTAQEVLMVTSPFDSGNGTLRATIAEALDGDTIRFSGVSAITLTSAGIEYDKDLVIEGPGMDALTISGNDQFVVLRAVGGSTRISGLTIQNGLNTFGSVETGGGMGFLGDTLEVSQVRFNACNQTGLGGFIRSGGGLYANGEHVRLIGCEFLNNTLLMGATDDGVGNGGGAAVLSPDFEVVDCLFAENVSRGRRTQSGAIGRGGGLYVAGTGTILSSTFTGNTANAVNYMQGNPAQNSRSQGGALYVAAQSVVRVEGCVLNDNILLGTATGQPRWHGAGIAALAASLELVDCELTHNQAPQGNTQTESRGGAVYIDDGLLLASGCLFQGNAARDGSGIYHLDGNMSQDRQGVAMQRCRIMDGHGNVSSGAIHTSEAEVIDLQDVEISGNDQRGLYYRFGDTLLVDRCLFERNRGGAWLEALATNENVFLNTTFHRNGADQGGAIRASDNTTFQMVNCTLVDDSLTAAGTSGRELHLDNSTVLLRNCILAETFVHGATAFGGANAVGLSAGGNVCSDASLAAVLVQGSDGNELTPGLDAFAENGGFTRTWSLLAGSTCVDRGGADTLGVDQRGFVRDASSDAGAYEFGALDAAIVVNNITDDVLLCVDEILELSIDAESEIDITYQWFLNDEEIPGADAATYATQVDVVDAGTYTCLLANGFSSVEVGPIEVQVSICTGIQAGMGPRTIASPNPFTDRVSLRFTDNGVHHLRLRDGTGRTIIDTTVQGSTTELEVGELGPGLYLVELCDAHGTAEVLRLLKVD